MPHHRTQITIMLFLLIFLVLSLDTSLAAVTGKGGGSEQVASPYGDKKGPPDHAPAHGYRAKHHYRYYPDSGVYFDTERKVYFYIENGSWRMSVSLPGFIHLGSAHVSLELDTDKPYRHYSEHQSKYPGGKKHNKSKKQK